MKPLNPRYQATFDAAVMRLNRAGHEAAGRSVDSLGIAALASFSNRERDSLLAAQFELNRNLSSFRLAFEEKMRHEVARELAPPGAGARPNAATAEWESLSLVTDNEVEAQVNADRFGLQIQHACEWELRELDAYMSTLLSLDRPDHDRNPLRPEVVGRVMVAAIEAVSERPEVRKVLVTEIGRTLAGTMPRIYADIVGELRDAGVQPANLTLRGTDGPGNNLGRNTSGYDAMSRPAPLSGEEPSIRGGTTGAGHWSSPSASGPRSSARPTLGSEWNGSHRGGPDSAAGRGSGSGWSGGHSGPGRGPSGGISRRGGGTAFGHVDAQMMSLIRRLAAVGPGADADGPDGFDAGADDGPYGDTRRYRGSGGYAGYGSASGAAFDDAGAEDDRDYDPGIGGVRRSPIAPNLIFAHREELRRAATSKLDHMVIDVVGSLFDQILSDAKVPPQMARLIARLQLPVLRVALGDPTFFSSRRHPVRRFVNRIASLACAFDDLGSGAGPQFVALVRDLVEEIVNGDFDQVEAYDRQLDRIESFVADQSRREVREQAADAPGLLEGKESDLVVQQRYMQQLRSALSPVVMPDFLRDFLSQVWSQAIVQASRRGGPNGEPARRMRRAARELVLSVQPKGAPADRKAFLMQLPQLMKDLNEGMSLIGWPESARKAFFSSLLPAHAESMRGHSISQLEYNLLSRQLDAIMGAELPKPGEATPPGAEPPVLTAVVNENHFTEEEAQRVGLVRETAVDWDGKVDIDVSAEPEVAEVDIQIDGLPAVEPGEPTRGASLAETVQLGFAYQMHLEGQWQKVRLSYVSPGRAFFVFSRGKKHQKVISMTARMLNRMCESGRMRAFENAYLIERATARARKQLATLRSGAGPVTGH